ncbi:MAG: hypothetical protein IMW89_22930 [Ktedonobacteraceae bacterium]|nr:hypothetical protein [Ktedonobacteraceae bacterium]
MYSPFQLEQASRLQHAEYQRNAEQERLAHAALSGQRLQQRVAHTDGQTLLAWAGRTGTALVQWMYRLKRSGTAGRWRSLSLMPRQQRPVSHR